MDAFINVINPRKFQFTNGVWNRLELNHPMSVGYVSALIESRPFASKEEWRDYYFKSGEERLALAKKRGIDLTLLSPEAKFLNGNYGRTEKELRALGKQMHNQLLREKNSMNISLAECIYMVKYRVIAETWNGIHLRELNTLKTLQKAFPKLSFKKVDAVIDFEYGIDFEVFENDSLICALQIKPLSYQKGKSKSILGAKKANQRKNEAYFNAYGKPVYYIYSQNNGNILNADILPTMHSHLILKQPAM